MRPHNLLFYHKYLPISYAIKEYQFFMICDSLEYTLHVIIIQFGVLCFTSEQRGYAVTAQVKKRQTLEFILEAASVNSNIVFMISGSAILPELVTVTFIGIRSSNLFTRGHS